MTFGGLSGVLPRQVVDTQMVERIEIFKGANALMNGAASSGVGGMINLEPKHAGELPQAKVGTDYTSDSQIGTTLDAGRRYGDSDQFGARVNWSTAKGKPAYRTTAAAPRCSPPVWITKATVSAPRWIWVIRRKPSTAARPASIFRRWISCPSRRKRS